MHNGYAFVPTQPQPDESCTESVTVPQQSQVFPGMLTVQQFLGQFLISLYLFVTGQEIPSMFYRGKENPGLPVPQMIGLARSLDDPTGGLGMTAVEWLKPPSHRVRFWTTPRETRLRRMH